MNYDKLHSAAQSQFSKIIAGAWRWHELSFAELEALVFCCLDHGITTFDHADIYGDHLNEKAFGDVLRKNSDLKKSMQLVSKVAIKFSSTKRPETWVKHYDTSEKHIRWSVDNSLTQLDVDHLDLLLLHRPDPLMDCEEVAKTFDSLKKSGKVLDFGVSNFTPAQFDKLQSYLSFPLVTNQIELSLFNNDPLFNGDVDHLIQNRVAAMAWSPLGGGQIFTDDADPIVLDGLNDIVAKYECSISQLLIAWLLRLPANVFPIIGTGKAARIEDSVNSLNIDLDRQDWFKMLELVRGYKVP